MKWVQFHEGKGHAIMRGDDPCALLGRCDAREHAERVACIRVRGRGLEVGFGVMCLIACVAEAIMACLRRRRLEGRWAATGRIRHSKRSFGWRPAGEGEGEGQCFRARVSLG